jgi:hypothetical protein
MLFKGGWLGLGGAFRDLAHFSDFWEGETMILVFLDIGDLPLLQARWRDISRLRRCT